jgi:hypothetical protein
MGRKIELVRGEGMFLPVAAVERELKTDALVASGSRETELLGGHLRPSRFLPVWCVYFPAG